jgi:hypothetical protein
MIFETTFKINNKIKNILIKSIIILLVFVSDIKCID